MLTTKDFYSTCEKYFSFNYNATSSAQIIWVFKPNDFTRLIFKPDASNHTIGHCLDYNCPVIGQLHLQTPSEHHTNWNDYLVFYIDESCDVTLLNSILNSCVRDIALSRVLTA